MDTWCFDPMRILLQHLKLEVVGKGKSLAESKRDIMIDQGLAYYVPYESFTYPKLLYAITLRHNMQGYEIRAFEE